MSVLDAVYWLALVVYMLPWSWKPMRRLLASLKATLTAAVRNATWLICWRTSCLAKAATAGSTTTPTTSRELNSPGAPGKWLHLGHRTPTLQIPTTSDSTSPGSFASLIEQGDLPEALPVGRTAGGWATSPEHCLKHVQPGVREYMADWPRMRCELIVECPEHGAVFYVRRGFVEARN